MAIFKLLPLALAIGALAQETRPSGPTQPGTASNCQSWYTIKSGDSCYSVETAFGITHAQFLKWNPAVSKDCLTNFWPKYSYCVGVSSMTTMPLTSRKSSSSSITKTSGTTKKSSTSPVTKGSVSSSHSSVTSSVRPHTSTTSSASTTYSIRNPITSRNLSTPTIDRTWPPKKTQAGQPPYCNKWYLVEGDDTCDTISRKFGSSVSGDELYVWLIKA